MMFKWLLSLFKPKRRRKRKVKKIAKIKKKKFKIKKVFLVSDLMSRNIISVSPNFTLEKTMQIFLENNISGAPVLEKNSLVGEISKTDILNFIKKREFEELTEEIKNKIRNTRVFELMKKPICIQEKRKVEEAKRKMEKYGISRLLVINKKGKLVGIITKTDLLRGISKEEIKENIFTKIDEMVKMLEGGPKTFSKISSYLRIPESLVEEWAKILEEHDLVEIHYPPIGNPVVKLKKLEV
ncbi:MAG: CBS domain-containing protein [Candidatus Aenigmatarchaeota archaeon]